MHIEKTKFFIINFSERNIENIHPNGYNKTVHSTSHKKQGVVNMEKLKLTSLFLALSILIVPVGKAEKIGSELCARLRTECVYQRLKTELEQDIRLALHSAAPDLEKQLLEPFGAYCLLVAAHIHWAPISKYSSWGGMLPRVKIPKGISRAFAVQQRVHAKLPDIIPAAPIVNWSYARYHYVCNPDLVYKKLPKKHRKQSLQWIKDKFADPSATTTRRVEHRTYGTW